jgi:eukaryotic-like serine/threonine-protein kinase
LARGTRLGRFLVLGLVGKGGMGEVYAAHDPELDRKVAIKVLRAGDGHGTSNEARARLIREAQAIAKVSHPNVIVVYEVGTVDGRVFIAMEFVDGHTLGYWLLAGSRTTAQILEAFGAAGRGLEAAHEKGLVHRDFKPDNAMVGSNGQVRVMDFGLARVAIDRVKAPDESSGARRAPAMNANDRLHDVLSTLVIDSATDAMKNSQAADFESSALRITEEGAILGTPAYMSPEQFRGEPADARSDQFSFCVALYEALYGERPFSANNVIELSAQVTSGGVRPEPPSARLSISIRRALLRGLSADPNMRFPSMNALLQEIGQEQTASGVRRFVAGAAARLAGIWEAPEGGSAVETEAKTEIRQAFQATDKPYAIPTFDLVRRILDRFSKRWTEIYVDACEATHVRGEQSTEVLDLRMGALGEALEDLRALCREFRRTSPDLLENAVNAANALGTLERCADVTLLRAIVRPPDAPATRAAVEQLQVRLSEVRALARVGRVTDGLKAAVALEIDARRTAYAPLLAEVLFACGALYLDVSDREAATRTLEDAVWTAELCRHDEVVAEAAAYLVFVVGHLQSRFDAGEIWSRMAETVLDRMGGHDLIRGWLFNSRATMRVTQGRLRDALRDTDLAIAAKQKVLGAEDVDVGLSIVNAAVCLDELGETIAAVEYAERAVRIIQASLGLDHPRAAIALVNYAAFLVRLERFAEARGPAQRALAVFERETDPTGLTVSYPLAALGSSLVGSGDFEEAVPLLERAASIRDAKETETAKLGEVHFALGRALWGAGLERSRALALTVRARDEYLAAPATPATQRELDEIDRWLSSRGLTKNPPDSVAPGSGAAPAGPVGAT